MKCTNTTAVQKIIRSLCLGLNVHQKQFIFTNMAWYEYSLIELIWKVPTDWLNIHSQLIFAFFVQILWVFSLYIKMLSFEERLFFKVSLDSKSYKFSVLKLDHLGFCKLGDGRIYNETNVKCTVSVMITKARFTWRNINNLANIHVM